MLLLGTNDSKPSNWESLNTFKVDYVSMAKELQVVLPDREGLYLIIPPPVFTKGPVCEIEADTVRQLPSVFPEILKDLELTQSNVIDAFSLLGGNEPQLD